MQAPVLEYNESSKNDEVDNHLSLIVSRNDNSSGTLFSWDIAICEDRGSIDTQTRALFEMPTFVINGFSETFL
jgi:hypothetical protein